MAERTQETETAATNNIITEAEQMSLSPRESLTGGSSQQESPDLPPHLRDSITRVPVTPGIQSSTYLAKTSTDSVKAASQGYFTRDPANQSSDVSQPPPTEPHSDGSSPTNLVKGATSDEEVLRRMSISTKGRRESISEIRAAAPDLALSGNIISVTFTTPYSLKYRKNGEWELDHRRGQSALFDSFSYLSSDEAPWNHTVVAWTGEIESPPESLSTSDAIPDTTANIPGISHLSAPIPLDGETPPQTPPEVDGLWITRESQLKLEQQLSHDRRIKAIPVWLADDNETSDEGITLNNQGRWRRYAEHTLYPLFHYKQHEPNDGRSERIEWADYFRTNLKFADKIIEAYKPGDIVVIHDYYLLLLPSMLRQRIPNMYISFFLHCPFPSSEFLRCLPRRKEVLEGMLGANLVGFQSYSYSRHFASCCTRILDFPSDSVGVDAYGSRVEVGVFPIGIDVTKVEQLAWSKEVSDMYKALKDLYKDKQIIVGRDRLDSVRGVAQKLMAFERFLELYPDWREKVVLVQVTSPNTIEEGGEEPENKIASRVNELVMRINGTYGSLGFSPVQHYPQYLSPEEYFALMRAADIGLITSVRDGMNTTSLEYVVCQRDTHGPLILSEFSGTAGSLRDAIHINPWDLTDVAHQIHHALTMSAEKRMAMQSSLYQHVKTQNVQVWITKFLRKLVGTLASTKNQNVTPLLDRTLMLKQYRQANRRLFMFDYDGTLTPIVRDPQSAVPSERVIQTLKALAADHRNAVWIISGRDQDFLQQHLGHISELGFSAEHGSFIRHPGSKSWENLAEKLDMGWQADVVELFQKYTDRVPGSFIERKRCALTWHYRQADPEQGVHASLALHKELESTVVQKWDVDVMKGKANLEVRPTFINKGEIAKRLVNDYNSDIAHIASGQQIDKGKDGKLEFVLCMGDDFTDEDMFRALNGLSGTQVDRSHVFTVTVGASTKVTLAKWHMLQPEDVVESIALLAGVGLSGEAHEQLSQVNLATVAGLEGRVPE
ncbi:glycosyltransferase family 20 protein [Daldinia vernicosa]|uniref:glycosyltransferase family 20 protein n=1 Tax=Daldinia vernicosa TaxID=114800 RepID=UPI0020073B3E|nr:glycosyltransferase family 20 protein [Daldinia vernicosa]KAI0844056.1 glycosyltransferase family 20 protein [Daldinia vernicosa]